MTGWKPILPPIAVFPGFLHPSIPLSSSPLSLFLCVFLCVLCASAFHFILFPLARNRLEARFP